MKYWDAHDNVCLLIAHPDDEVLFFMPTLALLKEKLERGSKQIFVFCCTYGPRTGRLAEHTRYKELKASLATLLDLPNENLMALNRPELRDGLMHQWDISFLVSALSAYVAEKKISWVLTFDRHGVSNHINHSSCWRASVELMSLNQPRIAHLRGAIQVTTLPTVLKYMSIIGILIWKILRMINSRADEFEHCWNPQYRSVLQGLRCHKSQAVWYRFLFVIFSTYAVYNELSEVDFSSVHVK